MPSWGKRPPYLHQSGAGTTEARGAGPGLGLQDRTPENKATCSFLMKDFQGWQEFSESRVQ